LIKNAENPDSRDRERKMTIRLDERRACSRVWKMVITGFWFACLLAAAVAPGRAAEPTARKASTVAEILAAAKPGDWRSPDPENTLYVQLAGGRVIIEMSALFAPRHVANVKALAREHYYDGLAIIRVQDNYVAQWGDPEAENPQSARKIQRARKNLPAEFERAIDASIPFTSLPDGDVYAGEVGFSDGFPVARDKRNGRMWLTHCYGMVGAARGTSRDSGGGTQVYVVIGQAPRQLDRNITLFGRVIQVMELLSSLPRGNGPMGFYDKPERQVPIESIRIAADVPLAERTDLEVMRTDTDTFRQLIEARRNRREEWFLFRAGRIELCNISIPVRNKSTPAGQ
jgi:peptidylprolyl isomerase